MPEDVKLLGMGLIVRPSGRFCVIVEGADADRWETEVADGRLFLVGMGDDPMQVTFFAERDKHGHADPEAPWRALGQTEPFVDPDSQEAVGLLSLHGIVDVFLVNEKKMIHFMGCIDPVMTHSGGFYLVDRAVDRMTEQMLSSEGALAQYGVSKPGEHVGKQDWKPAGDPLSVFGGKGLDRGKP